MAKKEPKIIALVINGKIYSKATCGTNDFVEHAKRYAKKCRAKTVSFCYTQGIVIRENISDVWGFDTETNEA